MYMQGFMEAKKKNGWGGRRPNSGRKQNDPEEKGVKFSIYMRKNCLDKLDVAAQELGITRSAFVIQSVAEKIERDFPTCKKSN